MKTKLHLFVAAFAVAALMACSAWCGEDAPAPQQGQQQISPADLFVLMAGEAEKGNSEAMLTLGSLYERGVGTPRNFVKAFEWYQKAANAGVPAGFYNVGVCYEVGMGNGGDMTKAFSNFEEAAKRGLNQALYKLASLYFTGLGTAKNETWGVELLTRAAAQSHAAAANDLGVIYYEGTFGQQKDPAKAFEWFTKAADLGHGEAMKNLAIFYRDGIGRPANKGQELKWYILAAAAGFPPQALAGVVDKLRGEMTEEQLKGVEADVQAWATAFQEKQKAAQAAQAAKQ